MNINGLPIVNTLTDSSPSEHGVPNLPSNVEYFAGPGPSGPKHGKGPGKVYHHRGGHGRYMVKPWNYDPSARAYMFPPTYGTRVYYPEPIKTCGGTDCNTFYNSKTKKYQSAQGSQCTCCSKGKVCRTNNSVPEGVKYQDCCAGLKCKGSGTQGICQ